MIGSKPLQRLSAYVSTWIVPVMRGVPMRGGELARIYNAGKALALVMNTAVQILTEVLTGIVRWGEQEAWSIATDRDS